MNQLKILEDRRGNRYRYLRLVDSDRRESFFKSPLAQNKILGFQLLNELICFRIGAALSFPVLEVRLRELPQIGVGLLSEFIGESASGLYNKIDHPGFIKPNAGFFVMKGDFPAGLLGPLRALLAFDQWIMNIDRRPDNLRLTLASHIRASDHEWSLGLLRREYERCPDFHQTQMQYGIADLGELREEIEQITSIERKDLREVIRLAEDELNRVTGDSFLTERDLIGVRPIIMENLHLRKQNLSCILRSLSDWSRQCGIPL